MEPVRTLIDTYGRVEQIRFDAIVSVRPVVLQLPYYPRDLTGDAQLPWRLCWVRAILINFIGVNYPWFYLDCPGNWAVLDPFCDTGAGRIEVWSEACQPPWGLEPVSDHDPSIPVQVYHSLEDALRGRKHVYRY